MATQYEVGAETEFFAGRLNATLAFYHLTKENLPTVDLSTPDPRDSVTIGEARSGGIEFKEYFVSANQFNGDPRAGIFPGEPLIVLGSIRLEF